MRSYKIIPGIIFLIIILMPNLAVSAAGIQQSGKSKTSMVLIKGGYYTPLFKKFGDKKNLYVKPFYIDIHAVTNEQYLQFVKANPD
ncbi:MAG: hypothetical protein WB779_08035 [Ignavibacteriaceae bacterium]